MKMTVMKPSYKKLAPNEVCAIDVNSDISAVGRIFIANLNETIFVVDSEWHLHGIISKGDYFRKATASKNIRELLNKNYKKIEVNLSEEIDHACVDDIADKIFCDMPTIARIPVVNNDKLLYVIDCTKAPIQIEYVSGFVNVKSLVPQGFVKLHLGCGSVYKEGWLNIDNSPNAKLDINWDLRKPLPFPDNSVDFIYNEHFLEHLTVEEGVSAIKDFYRVLKSNGVMRIALPCLEKTVNDYLDENWKENKKETFEKFGLTFIQTRAECINIGFRWWGHKWLYDWEELERRLKEAGCEKIKRCAIFESEHEELKNLETRNESTLIVEVTRL